MVTMVNTSMPQVTHVDIDGRSLTLDDGRSMPITNLFYNDEPVEFFEANLYPHLQIVAGPLPNQDQDRWITVTIFNPEGNNAGS